MFSLYWVLIINENLVKYIKDLQILNKILIKVAKTNLNAAGIWSFSSTNSNTKVQNHMTQFQMEGGGLVLGVTLLITTFSTLFIWKYKYCITIHNISWFI